MFINLQFNLITNLTAVERGRIICFNKNGILMRVTVFAQGNKTVKISENVYSAHTFVQGDKTLRLSLVAGF